MTPPKLPAEMPFAELVAEHCEGLRGGDRELSPLIELTAPRLVRLATSITRHQQDAEDAVQGVFVALADRPGGFINARQPWAYLLTSVRREALAVIRRSRRLTCFRTLADLTTWLPVDRLDQQETIEQVWRAVRRLPANQAEVVVLKLWEEMTFPEIAKVVGASVDTVASRYRYALIKLKRSLGNLCPVDSPVQTVPLGDGR